MSSNPVKYERYVPKGEASLAEDVPGWQGNGGGGPLCWKCRGTGKHKKKKKVVDCPVCDGCGTLEPKQLSKTTRGAITRARQCRDGWKPSGPMPVALTNSSCTSIEKDPTHLVKRANQGEHVVVDIVKDSPPWMPREGEELCNLVGSWRILQKRKNHKWTTDDLCTAYVAACEAQDNISVENYLDLGTGNGSVLQMVTWSLLSMNRSKFSAVGIEARREAVELARRSLQYNLGLKQTLAKIVHGDFRQYELDNQKFDLITGTPPYFRVDFLLSKNNNTVDTAIICQGGMPTAMQSAPARCEFRGGIEAYCQAASCFLAEEGRFVVCENWQNHHRVVEGANNAGLRILKMTCVEGRQGRGTLFCVYVMKKKRKENGSENDNTEPERETLAVRNEQGQWTRQYAETVLKKMSIPLPPST